MAIFAVCEHVRELYQTLRNTGVRPAKTAAEQNGSGRLQESACQRGLSGEGQGYDLLGGKRWRASVPPRQSSLLCGGLTSCMLRATLAKEGKRHTRPYDRAYGRTTARQSRRSGLVARQAPSSGSYLGQYGLPEGTGGPSGLRSRCQAWCFSFQEGSVARSGTPANISTKRTSHCHSSSVPLQQDDIVSSAPLHRLMEQKLRQLRDIAVKHH